MALCDGVDRDSWAGRLFDEMLGERLSPEQFEEAVRAHGRDDCFVFRAPRTAARLLQLARSLGEEHDAGYAGEDEVARFDSQWLVGKAGRPGAVHIHAPAEKLQSGRPSQLNRPPHCHDTGRIGLITSGRAVFKFVAQDGAGRHVVVDCPVQQGDLIFWPAWTPHTFNALEGFSVLSAMAAYVSPREDGFVFPLGRNMPDPDTLPQVAIQQFDRKRLTA